MSEKGQSSYEPDKPNQDRFLMVEDAATGSLLLAVFDGHGPNGHEVSQRLKDFVPDALFGHDSFPHDIPAALKACVPMVEAMILQSNEVDCTLSGSTVVLCVSFGDRLYLGNVGDSRAVLYKRHPSGRGLASVAVTRDHKPNLPSETKRILLAGGCIAPITYDDGTDGPHRVWLRDEEVPGLAMSRSVGDTIGKIAGVCSEVEVTEVQLTGEDFCVVVATDGLWEFLSNESIGDTIYKLSVEHGEDETAYLKATLEELVAISTTAWFDTEGVADDISIVVGMVGPA